MKSGLEGRACVYISELCSALARDDISDACNVELQPHAKKVDWAASYCLSDARRACLVHQDTLTQLKGRSSMKSGEEAIFTSSFLPSPLHRQALMEALNCSHGTQGSTTPCLVLDDNLQ